MIIVCWETLHSRLNKPENTAEIFTALLWQRPPLAAVRTSAKENGVMGHIHIVAIHLNNTVKVLQQFLQCEFSTRDCRKS